MDRKPLRNALAILRCSFCMKSEHEVAKLIAGPAVFICDECVDVCSEIVAENIYRTSTPQPATETSATPVKEIRCVLCRLHRPIDNMLLLPNGALCAGCIDAIGHKILVRPTNDETP